LRKRPHFIGLKFEEFDRSSPLMVESLRVLGRPVQPSVDCIPADAFDPCDGCAAHAFDGQMRNAIEGSTRASKPVVCCIASP
jgi:hypothetical protein